VASDGSGSGLAGSGRFNDFHIAAATRLDILRFCSAEVFVSLSDENLQILQILK
jgi:hypothetical protein